jgi:hypothetical protein
LVRIAQLKHGEGQPGQAREPRIIGVDGGEGAVSLGIVQGEHRLKMSAGFQQLTPPERADPDYTVTYGQTSGVAVALGRAERLRSNLSRRSVLGACHMEHPPPEQHGKQPP